MFPRANGEGVCGKGSSVLPGYLVRVCGQDAPLRGNSDSQNFGSYRIFAYSSVRFPFTPFQRSFLLGNVFVLKLLPSLEVLPGPPHPSVASQLVSDNVLVCDDSASLPTVPRTVTSLLRLPPHRPSCKSLFALPSSHPPSIVSFHPKTPRNLEHTQAYHARQQQKKQDNHSLTHSTHCQ
jgi:hypothetical protein